MARIRGFACAAVIVLHFCCQASCRRLAPPSEGWPANSSLRHFRQPAVQAFLASLSSQASKEAGPPMGAFFWASELIANILDGVLVALGEDGLDDISFSTWTAKLYLRLPSKVRGEVATPSKVPIAWLVERKLSFWISIDGTRLRMFTDGLYATTCDGMQLYSDSQASQSNDVTIESIRHESTRILDYIEGGIARSGILRAAKYYFRPGFLEDNANKLARIWYIVRESPGYALMDKSTASQLVYPMVLAKPMRFVSFDFADTGNVRGLRLTIRGELDTQESHNPRVSGEPAHRFFTRNRLGEKLATAFDPDEFDKSRTKAEYWQVAKSAVNWGVSVMAGDPLITARNGGVPIDGGIPELVVKMFKRCEGALPKLESGWQATDATFRCRDIEPGRAVWTRLET